MLMIFSLVGSMFMCSFSSILSAVILIILSVSALSVMYWNMMSVIPLYLFSLFMLGGLYVLIGFVMMADSRDIDMAFSSNLYEYLLVCSITFLGLKLNSQVLLSSFDCCDMIEFSPVKTCQWTSTGLLSGTFLFLIFLLFIYLFILHVMMKGSWGSGGFLNFQ